MPLRPPNIRLERIDVRNWPIYARTCMSLVNTDFSQTRKHKFGQKQTQTHKTYPHHKNTNMNVIGLLHGVPLGTVETGWGDGVCRTHGGVRASLHYWYLPHVCYSSPCREYKHANKTQKASRCTIFKLKQFISCFSFIRQYTNCSSRANHLYEEFSTSHHAFLEACCVD